MTKFLWLLAIPVAVLSAIVFVGHVGMAQATTEGGGGGGECSDSTTYVEANTKDKTPSNGFNVNISCASQQDFIYADTCLETLVAGVFWDPVPHCIPDTGYGDVVYKGRYPCVRIDPVPLYEYRVYIFWEFSIDGNLVQVSKDYRPSVDGVVSHCEFQNLTP